jgi:hypothetical protein
MIGNSSPSTHASAAVADRSAAPRTHAFPGLAAISGRAAESKLGAGVLGLGLVTLLMCAAHVRYGGFYYDDWSVIALGRYPLHGGLLHGLWLYYGQRPGQVLYYAALDESLGIHPELRLALAAATVTIEAVCLFALLRQLGMAARHGFAIAALALTFPFSDSVWLWGVLSLTSLAIAGSLLGIILALRALESSGRRAFALHTASLSLYLAGVLSYEIFALAGPLAGCLYVRAVGFRRARARWVIDVLAICAALAVARTVLPIDVATPSRTQSLAGMAAHAGLILRQGARLAGTAALPVPGISPWLGTGMLAGVLLLALVRLWRSSGASSVPELARWLAIAAAGALVAVAAWGIYVPAPNHYSPSAAGTVNRVNAGAAIGVAILVYSCLVLLARMLTRIAHVPRSAAGLGATAAALALGAAYLKQAGADARAWDSAAADQQAVMRDMHAVLPRPPRGATVYVFDAPQTVGPGIPVLNTTLDLSTALRLSFSSPSLVGVPVAARASVSCGPHGPLGDGVAGAYGNSYLVDAGARLAIRLTGPAQCGLADRSVCVRAFEPGPWPAGRSSCPARGPGRRRL